MKEVWKQAALWVGAGVGGAVHLLLGLGVALPAYVTKLLALGFPVMGYNVNVQAVTGLLGIVAVLYATKVLK